MENLVTVAQAAKVSDVVQAALKCLQKYGHSSASTWFRPAEHVAVGTIDIVYQAPDTLTKLSFHQLHAWHEGKRMLSVTWERDSSGPYKTIKFYPGAWIDELLIAAGSID